MSLVEHLAALQVVVPLLTAPLVLLMRVKALPWAVTTVTSLMAFLIALSLTNDVVDNGNAIYLMGSWQAPYGIELKVTSFSALLLLIVTAASTVALLAGKQSIDGQIESERQPLFYAAWLLALAGLVGIVVAGDAFNIFVFMEIASLASYVLIAAGPDRRALPAVFKYLIMGTIGATFYLIGVGLIYMMTGTLNLADMEARIHEVGELRPILVAAGFITLGLALKAAVFPLHVWLPNSYTYAPHIVTVFLAACSTKVALYVLLLFDFLVFQQNLLAHDLQFTVFLLPLAVLAILIGSAVALFERNLKRMLAYSSIAQVGYIALGASLVSVSGLEAGVLHMFNHALAKGTLFLTVACLAMRFNRLRLEDLSGAARQMPWTMAAFVVAGLSLIGVPGTAGFISKWKLIVAALAEGSLGIALVAVILVGSLLAVVYIWRVVEVVYFGDPAESSESIREAPVPMLVVTWTAVLANLYFGIYPSLPLTLAGQASTALLVHLP
ncbi:MAG: monovalent cation/H+ antiporter subunit D family protein [Gammaproteobacteria bacterium]|nr:monovalent cation/H+ antiporter subunit D family protein [Gammaproteobacteria bacterium]